MSKVVLKCGKFFDSVHECVKENVNVVVDGNKIVKVTSEAVDQTDAKVVDLSSKFVMPGMIDAHMHTFLNGTPGCMDDMAKLSAGDMAFDSMVNAQTDLMAGFTSIRDEGSYQFVDVALRDAINAGKTYGPRMLVSGMAIGSTGGHADTHFNISTSSVGIGSIVDGPDGARKAARYTLKYGADQIKIMATGGVMSIGDEPGAPEFTYEEMKAALDVSNSRGRISSAHAHGAAGIKIAIKAGITSIEHGMIMDDECIDLMVEHGTYLVPTIVAGQRIIDNGKSLPAEAVEKAQLCLSNHGKNLVKCREKGVKIAFGTDAGTYFNYHGKQAEEFELMQKYGDFSVTECLVACTKTNAQLFRWWDKVGSIEEGKLADIVAFDESPYDDITVMCRCSFVMKDGVIYKG